MIHTIRYSTLRITPLVQKKKKCINYLIDVYSIGKWVHRYLLSNKYLKKEVIKHS